MRYNRLTRGGKGDWEEGWKVLLVTFCLVYCSGIYTENVVRKKSLEDLDGSQSLDLGKVVKEKNPEKNENRGEEIREKGGGGGQRDL